MNSQPLCLFMYFSPHIPQNYIFFCFQKMIFSNVSELDCDCPKNVFFLPVEWNHFDFLQIRKSPEIRQWIHSGFPSAGVVKPSKETRPHSASGSFAHYHVLIACSMVQRVMWVHWSTKTHAISPSKRCLAMLHKAHLICITLALWCGIAYYINSCNLSNNFGSDLLHYQHNGGSSNTAITHLQFFPLFLYEKLQQQIN